MNHTSFLPSSGASPELEIILMLDISLMDIFNNWKHWERENDKGYKAIWVLTRYLYTQHAFPGKEEDCREIKQVWFWEKDHIKWYDPYQK